MRVLILSKDVEGYQNGVLAFSASADIKLAVGKLSDLNQESISIFDYDVTFIHVTPQSYNERGYYFYALPKLGLDVKTAMENGRTIICMPQAHNFQSVGFKKERGEWAYKWLEDLGIELRDSNGENIKPIGGGHAKIIQDYLNSAKKYYRIIAETKTVPSSKLAIVEDTEILVGAEYKVKNGTLVVLPPPVLDTNNYSFVMSQLIEIARRYYDRAQRRIPIEDMPDWLDTYTIPRVGEIVQQISHLEEEKSRYDLIAYVVYGTGPELETSVEALLKEIGLHVERQASSANIDFKATYDKLGYKFAIEVTGSKDIIRKDSNKVSQVWKHITECSGTEQQKDRIIIVSNTQYHLDPKDRNSAGYTPEIISLLGKNDVLMMTTVQLFDLWKAIYNKKTSSENVIRDLYNQSGLFQKTTFTSGKIKKKGT